MNRPSWASPSSAASSVAAARVASRYSSASGGSSNPWSRVTPASEHRVTVSAAALGVEQCGQGGRSAQQQVAVVLPGESDAAVHLDVELRVPVEGGKRERGRGGGRELEVRRRRRSRRALRPTRPRSRARRRRACWRSGASPPGTSRSGARTADGPWRTRCRLDALLRAARGLGRGEHPRELLRERERRRAGPRSARPGCP